jgi:pimeloyl-ACP methyl ester carboxylesterase
MWLWAFFQHTDHRMRVMNSLFMLGALTNSLFASAATWYGTTGAIVRQINVTAPSTILPTCNLYGTLSLPRHACSLVLFIAGSGPTDRDGNSFVLPNVQLDMYKLLGEGLNAAGFASLRFDKLGSGETRNCTDLSKLSQISVEAEVDDALAMLTSALDRVSAHHHFKKLMVLGHSEGSLQGMILTNKLNAGGLNIAAPIDTYISISGAAYNIHDVLITQLEPQLSPYPDIWNQTKFVLDELLAGRTVPMDQVPNVGGLQSMFSTLNQGYFIGWMKYYPIDYFKALNVDKTIVVQGTTDIQVSVDNGRALAAARPDAKYLEIDKMSHTLKFANSTAPADQVDSYQTSGIPLHPLLVPQLASALLK